MNEIRKSTNPQTTIEITFAFALLNRSRCWHGRSIDNDGAFINEMENRQLSELSIEMRCVRWNDSTFLATFYLVGRGSCK